MIKKFINKIIFVSFGIFFYVVFLLTNICQAASAPIKMNANVNPFPSPSEQKVPYALEIVSGNNQISSSKNLKDPLVVRLLDQARNPLPDFPIYFSFTNYPDGSTGFSVNITNKITDGNGLSSATVTFGNKEGIYEITASVSNLSVTFREEYKRTFFSKIGNFINSTINKVAQSELTKAFNLIIALIVLLLLILLLLFNYILLVQWFSLAFGWFILFLTKRKKQMGIVYSSVSKKLLPNISVQILSSKNNELIKKEVTNKYGFFSLKLEAGQYYIQITSDQFAFPSKYDSEGYHGSPFEIKLNKPLILKLPVDPIKKINVNKFIIINKIISQLNIVFITLLIVGSLIAVPVAYYNAFDLKNIIILYLYAISWFIVYFVLKKNQSKSNRIVVSGQ